MPVENDHRRYLAKFSAVVGVNSYALPAVRLTREPFLMSAPRRSGLPADSLALAASELHRPAIDATVPIGEPIARSDRRGRKSCPAESGGGEPLAATRSQPPCIDRWVTTNGVALGELL